MCFHTTIIVVYAIQKSKQYGLKQWIKHKIRDKKIKRIGILTTEDEWIGLTSNNFLLEETENPLYFSIILHNN